MAAVDDESSVSRRLCKPLGYSHLVFLGADERRPCGRWPPHTQWLCGGCTGSWNKVFQSLWRPPCTVRCLLSSQNRTTRVSAEAPHSYGLDWKGPVALPGSPHSAKNQLVHLSMPKNPSISHVGPAGPGVWDSSLMKGWNTWREMSKFQCFGYCLDQTSVSAEQISDLLQTTACVLMKSPSPINFWVDIITLLSISTLFQAVLLCRNGSSQ